MYFRNETFENWDTRGRSNFWLPEPASYVTSNVGNKFTQILLEGERRIASSNILGLIFQFSNEDEIRRRVSLGHDCGTFALACQLNDPLSHDRFNQAGGKKIVIDGKKPLSFAAHNNLETGSVILASLPGKSEKQTRNLHLMVRATTDEGEPLYASKLGTYGPVVLSTLISSLRYYVATELTLVDRLYVEDYPITT